METEMQSSATCQASRFGDWAKEDKLLEASVFGFRGWQVNPNLIFGDGEIRRRPQNGGLVLRHRRNLCREAQRADGDRRAWTEWKLKEAEDDRQHRRLRLRSASQGSAPAPAAQRHSTATKENQEHLTRVQTGNSVSPLDKTYHGGPQTALGFELFWRQ